MVRRLFCNATVSERSKPETTTQPLSVGCLIFERIEQIDFTGPFESLSRMPDTTVQIIGKEVEQVRRWTWRLRRGFGNEENMTALPIASQVIADPEARNHAKKLNAKV